MTAIAVASRWTMTTTAGHTISGPLPPWDECNPSRTDVTPDLLRSHLSDLTHCRSFPGQTLDISTGAYVSGDGKRYVGPAEVLRTQITCRPYDDDPAERVPLANVELLAGGDDWIENLDPNGVADLAAKLRAQADRLDEVRVQLIAARADWAANGRAEA